MLLFDRCRPNHPIHASRRHAVTWAMVGRDYGKLDQRGFAIDADRAFYAKVPLIALLRRRHFWVVFLVLVVNRR